MSECCIGALTAVSEKVRNNVHDSNKLEAEPDSIRLL